MIDIKKILYEVCGDKRVNDDDIDLFESGLLDSFAFIELFSTLEDLGVELQPTRILKNDLRTPGNIQKLVNEYIKNNTKKDE